MRDGDLEYDLKMQDGDIVRVSGIQVGCFAVRWHPGGWGKIPANVWSLEHWPTGCVVLVGNEFDQLMAVADDLSRFANRPPVFSEPNEDLFWVHLGQHLKAWMSQIVVPAPGDQTAMIDAFVPFRDWAEKQGANPAVILRRQPALEAAA